MSRDQIIFLAAFVTVVSFGALIVKSVLVYLAFKAWRVGHLMPVDSPVRIVAEGELIDSLLRLVQVLVLVSFGFILDLGVIFGSIQLEGTGGWALASIWMMLTVIPVIVGVRRLIEQRRLRDVLRPSLYKP